MSDETPLPTFYGHVNARTDEARQAAYEVMVARTEPYFAKIIADGDKPWFDSDDQRRERFMRRYVRPPAPSQTGLSLDLTKIRGGDGWTPVEPDIQELEAA